MTIKKTLFSFLLAILSFSPASAQELSIEGRMAFEGQSIDGYKRDDNTGFRGKYLQINFLGDITKDLHFRYQHSLNKLPETKTASEAFFENTNIFDISWDITDKLTVSGGKQIVALGGYEYNTAPIDFYYISEFSSSIACYQYGASVAYKVTDDDKLTLQLCDSPLRRWTGSNKYGVNLLWQGRHFGFWETQYSVSMIQNSGDRWMNYVVLGNRFDINDDAFVQLDLMNRAGSRQNILLKDWTLIAEASYEPLDRMRCFAKYTYDHNTSGTLQDMLVFDGTEISGVSLGVEYNPMKSNADALRLFAIGGYSFGKNGKLATPYLQDKSLRFQMGVKVHVDALGTIKNYMKK